MDKFETELFTQVMDTADELQGCFIDDDAYSRTPSFEEWRRASKLTRKLTLIGYELQGYAKAKRQFDLETTKAQLRIVEPEANDFSAQKAELVSFVDENGFLKFTDKEILEMPKKFRKQFRMHGITAHVRITKDGLFQIRCRSKGFDIQATSKYMMEAKEKFIRELFKQYPSRGEPIRKKPKPVLLHVFATDWLEHVKRPYIKEGTYADYEMTFRVHIFPVLGNSNISAIKPMDIQCFINNFGDSRTGEKAYKLLKPVFDYAVASGIIERSPMALIKKPYHEPESGVALTIEEERVFLAALEGSEYKFLFICILYLGLRRSEVKSIVFDQNFVTVVSAKQRRGRREQVRRIPITPMLRKYLPGGEIPQITDNAISHIFKRFCPEHHVHDLRHTFITRCQECGVSREIVSLWAGHKADDTVTTNVYTHFSEDFQLKEAQKVLY